MKTVLLAWELGEGLGHIGGLRLIAKELVAQGWQPVLALRDVSGTSAVLKDDGFRVLQAPVLANPIPPEGRPFGPSGYADILAIYGFYDADILGPMVAAWQNLIDLVKPDLIVADHSPTLCLAAHGSVPVVVVGYGFTVPPCDLPEFPVLRPEVPPIASQAKLLDVVNQVQRDRDRPTLDRLPDLLPGSMQAVCTYPALDPYRRFRREPAIGPLEPVPAFVEPPGKPHLFAYLATDYQALDQLAVALGELKIPVSVYIRGRPGAIKVFLRKRGATVYDRPPPLGEVLPASSFVLSHGGIGMAHAALAAGRPHIIAPRHFEASLTAKALQSLGIGVHLDVPAGSAPRVRNAFEDIMSQSDLAERAAQIAANLAAQSTPDALSSIVRHCETLVETGASAALSPNLNVVGKADANV
jgi:UDP:flavonoid glycosyltransferase YjiC (YdhE family)